MMTFSGFLWDESGAITIDWVGLTAGVLVLAIMVVYAIFNTGGSQLVSTVNSTLDGITTGVTLPVPDQLNG